MMSLVIVIIMLGAMSIAIRDANSAEVNMPARVVIVQCGKKKDLMKACTNDPRCCSLIEPAAGDDDQGEDDNSQTNYEILDYNWTVQSVDEIRKQRVYE